MKLFFNVQVFLLQYDDGWSNCRHIVTGEEGHVPTKYLDELTFKIRNGEQSMFLAIADFSSEVEGDLQFRIGKYLNYSLSFKQSFIR